MGWYEWINLLAPFVLLIVSTLLSIAGYFGKKTIDGFGGELKALRGDHLKFREDFLIFQAQLPRNYVLKDDHIRHITIVEKKIDDHASATYQSLASIESDIKMLLRDTAKRKTDG